LSRDQLYDVVDELRDEIGDIADERDEWAWAADELAAVLTVLCESTQAYGRVWRARPGGGHELMADEGAAIWTRADAALARWTALGAEE